MTPFTTFLSDNYNRQDLIGVEVGVMEGINAVYLLEDLPIKKLYLVDNYKEYNSQAGIYPQDQMDTFYGTAIKAVEPYFEKTRFVVRDSVWAAQQFPDEYFDFVYIDAGHTYEDVMSDMNAWWPKCKRLGLFGGHDYRFSTTPDVKKAVDDFITQRNIPISLISHDASSGLVSKDPSIGIRVGESMEWGFFKP